MLPRFALLWMLLPALAAGCSRSGFDPGSDRGLDLGRDAILPDSALPDSTVPTVSTSATLVDVVVSGRFRLVFDLARSWQAVGWYDLATDPTQNLAGQASALKFQVVQSPVGVRVGQDWFTLSHARDASIAVVGSTPAAVLDTRWHWSTSAGRIDVRAIHTIEPDGRWQTEVTVTPTQPSVQLTSWEYAYTNVAWSLGWTVATDTSGFSFTRGGGPSPWPMIEVAAADGVPGTVATDLEGNRYFDVSQSPTLTPASPLSFGYENRIWRP